MRPAARTACSQADKPELGQHLEVLDRHRQIGLSAQALDCNLETLAAERENQVETGIDVDAERRLRRGGQAEALFVTQAKIDRGTQIGKRLREADRNPKVTCLRVVLDLDARTENLRIIEGRDEFLDRPNALAQLVNRIANTRAGGGKGRAQGQCRTVARHGFDLNRGQRAAVLTVDRDPQARHRASKLARSTHQLVCPGRGDPRGSLSTRVLTRRRGPEPHRTEEIDPIDDIGLEC